MTDLQTILSRLGLEKYLASFIEEGFDSWENLLDITESDLELLNVKLGHRRRLQREIANARGLSIEQVIPAAVRARSIDVSHEEDERVAHVSHDQKQLTTTGKRKYRRHPKVSSSSIPPLAIIYKVEHMKAFNFP
jgi:hypothetical protein